jgi:hypothetical protein
MKPNRTAVRFRERKHEIEKADRPAARVPWNGYTGNRSPRRRRILARKKNRLTAAWLREEDESTRRTSTVAAYLKPRPKTERRTAHSFGKRMQTKPTAREGNPSACFVEPENGPGRINDEAKHKPHRDSFGTGRKSLARAEINTENHTKM